MAVLYGREPVLRSLLPFQYGGGMVAEGRVLPGHVEYLALPGSYRAGPPGVLARSCPRRPSGCCWTWP